MMSSPITRRSRGSLPSPRIPLYPVRTSSSATASEFRHRPRHASTCMHVHSHCISCTKRSPCCGQPPSCSRRWTTVRGCRLMDGTHVMPVPAADVLDATPARPDSARARSVKFAVAFKQRCGACVACMLLIRTRMQQQQERNDTYRSREPAPPPAPPPAPLQPVWIVLLGPCDDVIAIAAGAHEPPGPSAEQVLAQGHRTDAEPAHPTAASQPRQIRRNVPRRRARRCTI